MVHTAQLSVSTCVSVALSLFSGFRVEQTLLKHTGPHAYTNTINSGACLHLHLFPDQKTHTRAVTHMHRHTQTAFLWGTQMLKVLWVLFISVLRQMDRDTIHLFDLLCEKQSSFTLCPQIGQLHMSSNHFLTWVSWCLHKFSDTLPTHHAWKEVSRTV